MTPQAEVAARIQALIDDLEARIPTAGVIQSALEAQLAEQRRQLAYVRRNG